MNISEPVIVFPFASLFTAFWGGTLLPFCKIVVWLEAGITGSQNFHHHSLSCFQNLIKNDVLICKSLH